MSTQTEMTDSNEETKCSTPTPPLVTCDSQTAAFIRFIVEVIGLFYQIIYIYLECLKSVFFGRQEKDVSCQVVVITGAGHGFGRELALEFASRGANLALIDINLQGVEEVAKHLSHLYPELKVFPLKCDVTSVNDVNDVFTEIKESLGPVDILVNNAGVVSCKPILDLDARSIVRTFNVNCISHFWTIQAVLPDMIQRRTGHLVTVSSSTGLTGVANLTDDCASKFASIGLMKALELELQSNGFRDLIHLSTICPLAMSTGMFQSPKSRFPAVFGTLDPVSAAKKAVYGILTNESLVCIPKRFEYFHRISQVTPSKVSSMVQQFFEYGVDAHDKKML